MASGTSPLWMFVAPKAPASSSSLIWGEGVDLWGERGGEGRFEGEGRVGLQCYVREFGGIHDGLGRMRCIWWGEGLGGFEVHGQGKRGRVVSGGGEVRAWGPNPVLLLLMA